jgi:putative polyhydroxyalkanoate system protein
MAKLQIEQKHGLPADEVKRRLDAMNDKLGDKYGIKSSWKSDSEATFTRTGATGTIKCQPDKVVVTVELGFGLGFMKDQVESRIKRELERALSDEGSAST